jgi:hypothetical protein
MLILAASIVVVSFLASMNPQYYVAIDAISGLDLPATNNLSKPPAQQVEFNLTVGVKSRNPFLRGFFQPGAIVTVTYLGVQIADGS